MNNYNHIKPSDILTNFFPINEKDIVADLGCGQHGYFVFTASKMTGKSGKVYAVDILKRVLDNIKKICSDNKITNIETVHANLEKQNSLKIQDNIVDKTIIANILFQNKKWENILKEAIRITKPNGFILIIDWNPKYISLSQKAANISSDIVKTTSIELGLKFIREDVFGETHFALVFQK